MTLSMKATMDAMLCRKLQGILSPFSSCNLTYCISYQSFKVLTSSFKVGLSTTESISWQKTKLLSSL